MFGPFKQVEALFMSQYVNVVDRLGEASAGALRLEFWMNGRRSSQLRAHLDVVYADRHRRMSVVVSPAERRVYVGANTLKDFYLDEEFMRSCTIVPNYGPIRAIMLQFAVDYKLVQHDFIYIDDVSLRVVSPDDAALEDCPLYVNTFPVSHQVIADFLRPVVGEQSDKSKDDVADDISGITLVTQLTTNQFPALRRAVAEWNGPVSAAVLVCVGTERGDLHSALREITEAYYSSKHLRSFATIHVIIEDLLNRAAHHDSVHHPAIFLRNVAIAHVHTSHLFYIDVDTFPAFCERQARTWLKAADETSRTVPPRAYVVPLFQSNSRNKHMDDFPRTKPELLHQIRDHESGIEPYHETSHAAVKYSQWMATGELYAIKYVDDMEPYFIISASRSPIMSDLYVGYGPDRDRCAYSRDVASAGFQFVVLPYAFLFKVPEIPDAPTMTQRSKNVHLDTFLDEAFHTVDLKAGFFHLPSFNAYSLQGSGIPAFPASGIPAKEESIHKVSKPAYEQPTSEECVKPDDQCDHQSQAIEVVCLFDELPTITEAEATQKISQQRLDIVVEGLMEALGVTTFVEASTDDSHYGFSFFLSRTQLEAAVMVRPFADKDAQFDYDGVVREYLSRGSMDVIIRRVRDDFPGPKIF